MSQNYPEPVIAIGDQLHKTCATGVAVINESFGKRKDTLQKGDVARAYMYFVYAIVFLRIDAYAETHPDHKDYLRRFSKQLNEYLDHKFNLEHLALFFMPDAMSTRYKYKEYFTEHPDADHKAIFIQKLRNDPIIKVTKQNSIDLGNVIDMALNTLKVDEELDKIFVQKAAKKSFGCLSTIACAIMVLALLAYI